MKIQITAREALDKGIWDEVCELKGWSVWILNEGRMDSSELISLTEEEAEKLGLINKKKDLWI